MADEKKKKKGLLAAIWESMTKTCGCCGSGEDCCGPSQQEQKAKPADKKEDTDSEARCTS
ncbi:hypothetical protein ACFLSJ_07430 [Verrucomicrobiota bacterium]